jgi:glyoxylase-like metal-dependent hydrolase (beta-lactamase superfamily II)
MPAAPVRILRFALLLQLGLGLVACKPASLQIMTYSSDSNFTVNAYLLVGERQAVLIDTGFNRTDANAIVEMIRRTGRELRYIVLTHAHPDHYLGTDIILEAFAGVPVEATSIVLLDFRENAQAAFNQYKSQLGSQIADRVVTPFLLPGNQIEFEGHTLTIFEQQEPGESRGATFIGVDDPRVLLAGDVVYNNVHPVLAECQTEGWKRNIEFVRGLGYTTIYPGHGPVAQDTTVLDATRDYLNQAVPILTTAATVDEAKAMLTSRYPNYGGASLLDFSVTRYFSRCRTPR